MPYKDRFTVIFKHGSGAHQASAITTTVYRTALVVGTDCTVILVAYTAWCVVALTKNTEYVKSMVVVTLEMFDSIQCYFRKQRSVAELVFGVELPTWCLTVLFLLDEL